MQANASAADESHRFKCELVYMRDREEKLKLEVSEAKQELQVLAAGGAGPGAPSHHA